MRLARLLRRPVVWLPISLGLLAFLTWRSRLWEAGDRLSIVAPGYLLVAVLLNLVVAFLWAARSADLLGAAGRPVGIGPLVPMTAFANTINNLTPGSVGEVVRVWLLRAHHGVDYATGAAVVAIERLLAFGYLAGSAAIVWLGHVAGWPDVVVLVLLVILAAAPGVVYRVGIRPSALVAAVPGGRVVGAARWDRATTWLRRVDETIASLVGHPARLVVFVVLTAVLFALFAGQVVLVAASLGTDLALAPTWGALGLAMTAGILSMLPFGLGSMDLVLVAALGVLGVDATTATAIAFGNRLVASLPTGILGVVSYAWLSARLPEGGTGRATAEVGAALGGQADARAASDGRAEAEP